MPKLTHAHGFWVGMGSILLFMGGHRSDIIVHPCIQFQIEVKILGCREYVNQEVFQAEASDSERPFICPIQPRHGVGG